MKRLNLLLVIALILSIFTGCQSNSTQYDIAATTLPVYEFTTALCSGTDLRIGRMVTESISCLHDYTLQVRQMRMLESAQLVVISGAGLEDFLVDALTDVHVLIDASTNTRAHGHDHCDAHGDHHHEQDPHIWLSPPNARIMAQNIYTGLIATYPENTAIFSANLESLLTRLEALEHYGNDVLSTLSCRDLITFHDGFSYFAECFGLNILYSAEEESGSEASAAELKHLIQLVKDNRLPAVFTEMNGSDAAAKIIGTETGVGSFTLDMAMSGNSYFTAMYHNINTIKEALG